MHVMEIFAELTRILLSANYVKYIESFFINSFGFIYIVLRRIFCVRKVSQANPFHCQMYSEMK
jgi:hypothetical protein